MGGAKNTTVLEKMWIDRKEFVSADDLRGYCASFGMDYTALVNYLTKMRYLVRIFRGMFYVRSAEEIRRGNSRYSYLELVSRGLDMKGVKNWYFGLRTALKLNNMTHEYFTIDDVVSDSLFRPRPVTIGGNKFKFTKLSPKLFGFGVAMGNTVRYSDPEKTVLDIAYLRKRAGMRDARIASEASGWAEFVSRERIWDYARRYPETVRAIVGGALNDR